MVDLLRETFAALRADAVDLPLWVQIWMKGIALSMLAGIAMAFINRRALWIVGAMAMTVVALFVVKAVWPDVPRGQIGTWAHLILWPPALFMLWRGAKQSGARGLYLGWKYWVSTVMAISLVLDFYVVLRGVF